MAQDNTITGKEEISRILGENVSKELSKILENDEETADTSRSIRERTDIELAKFLEDKNESELEDIILILKEEINKEIAKLLEHHTGTEISESTRESINNEILNASKMVKELKTVKQSEKKSVVIEDSKAEPPNTEADLINKEMGEAFQSTKIGEVDFAQSEAEKKVAETEKSEKVGDDPDGINKTEEDQKITKVVECPCPDLSPFRNINPTQSEPIDDLKKPDCDCVSAGSACSGCGFVNTGKRVSPIAIELKNLVVKTYPPLEFTVEYKVLPTRMFTVWEHNFNVYVQYGNPDSIFEAPVISGGPLSGPYKFLKFQLHWGPDDTLGSEHTINGKPFVMELQAIHLKEEISPEVASRCANAYAILSYFFEKGEEDNPGISKLLNNFLDFEEPFPISDLIKPFSESYMTYPGSLTCHSCSENVIWILSPYLSKVSDRQLKYLREIKCINPNNFKAVQDLNDRVIFMAERNDNLHKRYNVAT